MDKATRVGTTERVGDDDQGFIVLASQGEEGGAEKESEKESEKGRAGGEVSTVTAQLHERLFSSIPAGVADPEWANRFLLRWFIEYERAGFSDQAAIRLTEKFAAVERPAWLGPIVMKGVRFASRAPRFGPIRLIRPKRPLELRFDTTLVYDGGFHCTVVTSVFGISVSLDVSLDKMEGKVLFICPPATSDPICSLSFYKEPMTTFTVTPAVGDRKITNLPSVTRFLSTSLERMLVVDTVLPNGLTFHLPLGASWSQGGGRGMQWSTVRRVREGLQRAAARRLRGEEEAAAAAAAAAATAATVNTAGSASGESAASATSRGTSPTVPRASKAKAAGTTLAAEAPSKSARSTSPTPPQPLSMTTADDAATAIASSSSAADAAGAEATAASLTTNLRATVGSTFYSLAAKAKEARARQLQRAADDLERERERRARLAAAREERERQYAQGVRRRAAAAGTSPTTHLSVSPPADGGIVVTEDDFVITGLSAPHRPSSSPSLSPSTSPSTTSSMPRSPGTSNRSLTASGERAPTGDGNDRGTDELADGGDGDGVFAFEADSGSATPAPPPDTTTPEERERERQRLADAAAAAAAAAERERERLAQLERERAEADAAFAAAVEEEKRQREAAEREREQARAAAEAAAKEKASAEAEEAAKREALAAAAAAADAEEAAAAAAAAAEAQRVAAAAEEAAREREREERARQREAERERDQHADEAAAREVGTHGAGRLTPPSPSPSREPRSPGVSLFPGVTGRRAKRVEESSDDDDGAAAVDATPAVAVADDAVLHSSSRSSDPSSTSSLPVPSLPVPTTSSKSGQADPLDSFFQSISPPSTGPADDVAARPTSSSSLSSLLDDEGFSFPGESLGETPIFSATDADELNAFLSDTE